MGPPVVSASDLAALVARVEALLSPGGRVLLGIAGPPGAGKSTLAATLHAAVPVASVVVPFDGFHLPQHVLVERGLADRKGALPTFDLDGYRALLLRLRRQTDPVVYAPAYCREIEEVVADAIPVGRDVPLVLTEGNYLLRPEAGLGGVLDETWFLETDDGARRDRLVERHVRFGKPPEQARDWVLDSDERNAELVAPDRDRADLVVRIG